MNASLKVLFNEDISKYTTVKIGGIAEKMYFPQNVDQLIEIKALVDDIYILGGGSNLLIANRKFDSIINLSELDKTILNMGCGIYKVGASVRLQELINKINSDGFGGIEYLISVPGLVGGAVVMNAGPGKMHNKSISDYIVSVTVLKDKEIITLDRNQCNFGNRTSLFKNNEAYIVLSVEFKFSQLDKELTTKLKKERLSFCRNTQDNSAPNFGSVFSTCNTKIMDFIRRISFGKKKSICFSSKSANWIINKEKKNDFNEAYRLIKLVKNMHKILRKKCEVEVIIWR